VLNAGLSQVAAFFVRLLSSRIDDLSLKMLHYAQPSLVVALKESPELANLWRERGLEDSQGFNLLIQPRFLFLGEFPHRWADRTAFGAHKFHDRFAGRQDAVLDEYLHELYRLHLQGLGRDYVASVMGFDHPRVDR
jgi:hypothetical protein